MKVFLKSKNDKGNVALNKLLVFWNGKNKFRVLRMMGNRVSFSKTADNPLTVSYSQVDFQVLPNTPKAHEKVEVNLFHQMKTFGIDADCVEVEFQ